MKILFLFTKNKSFLSDYFVALAKHLVTRGDEVVVFSFKNNEHSENQHGITFIAKRAKGITHKFIAIYRLIRTEVPDTVISNFTYVNTALLAGKCLNVPKNIAWQHSLIAQTRASRIQILIKSFFLRWADRVVVNSNNLKNELESNFGLEKETISLLPFWSSIERYDPKKIVLPKNDYIIGCCGRIEIDKNQRLLLEAFAELNKRLPNKKMHLVFAGDGADVSYLEEMSKKLSLENCVHFLGLLSAEEMAYFYPNINVLVLPSLHEAFGLTFIEALALNTPVLVSKSFGALSYIEASLLNEYDMLFEPKDIIGLTNKLENFINDEFKEINDYRVLYDTFFSEEVIKHKFDRIIE